MIAPDNLKDHSLLEKVIESLPHPFYVIDAKNYELVMANSAVQRMYGSAKGHKCYCLLHEADKPCSDCEHDCPLDQVKTTKKPVAIELPHVAEGRQERQFAVHCYPVFDTQGEVCLMIGYYVDITRRKQAERARAESERRLTTLLDNLPGMAYRYLNDQSWTAEFVSQGCQKLTGYSPEDMIGNRLISYNELIHPEDRPFVRDHIQSALTERQPFQLTYRIYTAEQEEKWVWEQGRGVFDHQGRVLALEGLVTDISGHKQAATALQRSEEALKTSKEALRTSEAKYRQLIETTNTGYLAMNAEGKVLDANSEYVRQSGRRSLGEIQGRSVLDWTAEHHITRLRDELAACAERGYIRNLEIDYVDREGKLTTGMINATSIQTAGGLQILTLSTDMTLQKKLEGQLRMESLGTLIRGIAHDFNNILTRIMGYLSLLKSNSDSFTEEQRNYLGVAERASKRGADIVQKLHHFSQPRFVDQGAMDIYEAAQEVFSLLEATTNRLINKEISLPRGRYFVEADAADLSEVILNLATNSIYSLEERGVRRGDFIRISAQDCQADEQEVLKLAAGEYLKVTFEDNGEGIPHDAQRRIFEPGFSTKPQSNYAGQGFGLAIVYKILKGNVVVESSEGKGTKFHLYFPKARNIPRPENAEGSEEYTGGQETILVVDDEPDIRRFVKIALERSGYQVLTAADGEQALEIFRDHLAAVRLVLLDLTMPKMSGEKLFDELKHLNPQCRCIIFSGHGETELKKGSLQQADGYLTKPFTGSDLLQKVRIVLDS